MDDAMIYKGDTVVDTTTGDEGTFVRWELDDEGNESAVVSWPKYGEAWLTVPAANIKKVCDAS